MVDTFKSPGFFTALVGRLADITGSEWGQKLYNSMRGQEQDTRAALHTGTPEKPVIAASLPVADFPSQSQLPQGHDAGRRHLG